MASLNVYVIIFVITTSIYSSNCYVLFPKSQILRRERRYQGYDGQRHRKHKFVSSEKIKYDILEPISFTHLAHQASKNDDDVDAYETIMWSDGFSYENKNKIDNDKETFVKLNKLHYTSDYLCQTLPMLLDFSIEEQEEKYNKIKNDEDSSIDHFYSSDFQLVAAASREINDEKEVTTSDDDEKNKDVVLLSSRDDLINLSYSLVSLTSITKQVIDLLLATSPTSTRNSNFLDSTDELFNLNCSIFVQYPIEDCDRSDNEIEHPNSSFVNLGSLSVLNSSSIKDNLTLNDDRITQSTATFPPKMFVEWSTLFPSFGLSVLLQQQPLSILQQQQQQGKDKYIEIKGLTEIQLDYTSNHSEDERENTDFRSATKAQISKYRLISVEVEDRQVPIASVAKTLNQLLQNVQNTAGRTVAMTPSNAINPFLSFVKPFLMDQQQKRRTDSSNNSSSLVIAPLYVQIPYSVIEKDEEDEIMTTTKTFKYIPVDQVELFSPDDGEIRPLPGSKNWIEYSRFLSYIHDVFLPVVLPSLAKDTDAQYVSTFFTENSSLYSSSREKLLSSNQDIAQLYANLSLLRSTVSSFSNMLENINRSPKNTIDIEMAEWKVTNLELIPKSNEFILSWKSSVPILLDTPPLSRKAQSSQSVLKMEGKDLFSIHSDSDKIESIEQLEFRINGNIVQDPQVWNSIVNTLTTTNTNNNNNSMGRMSPIVSSLLPSVPSSIIPAMEIFTNLWKLTSSTSSSTSSLNKLTSPQKQKSSTRRSSKKASELSQEEAASAYYFMKSLHSDLPESLLPNNSIKSPAATTSTSPSYFLSVMNDMILMSENTFNAIPGEKYLSPNIKLKGYFEETLSQGLISYRQIISFALSFLRIALYSQTFFFDEDQEEDGETKQIISNVELTSKGDIKWRLVLPLRINTRRTNNPLLPPLPPNPFSSLSESLLNMITRSGVPGLSEFSSSSNADDNGDSIPCTVEILSIYKVQGSKDDGQENTSSNTSIVKEHILLESRINGVLTPGDILSRWIQRISQRASSSERKRKNKKGKMAGGGFDRLEDWIDFFLGSK